MEIFCSSYTQPSKSEWAAEQTNRKARTDKGAQRDKGEWWDTDTEAASVAEPSDLNRLTILASFPLVLLPHHLPLDFPLSKTHPCPSIYPPSLPPLINQLGSRSSPLERTLKATLPLSLLTCQKDLKLLHSINTQD
ncbi:hypothetical protein PGT21_030398 [Puccinia graminis f. sp. tritici]|uniref:Uncharacterized protein n=1 Tax=Puccinia graminis f. sp. tritici TaxID=56615 RepID=A0A5B0NU00_PUCGR|nr:hypothetical protein PGTUg99_029694 [Puccinia graminis f. sp. tritici]KAA1091289.1 hypothetical protein PGT21_030398 [Puccinia graminis f. sp. tritici]